MASKSRLDGGYDTDVLFVAKFFEDLSSDVHKYANLMNEYLTYHEISGSLSRGIEQLLQCKFFP